MENGFLSDGFVGSIHALKVKIQNFHKIPYLVTEW